MWACWHESRTAFVGRGQGHLQITPVTDLHLTGALNWRGETGGRGNGGQTGATPQARGPGNHNRAPSSAHEPGRPGRPAFEKGRGRESTGGHVRTPRSPTWRRRGRVVGQVAGRPRPTGRPGQRKGPDDLKEDTPEAHSSELPAGGPNSAMSYLATLQSGAVTRKSLAGTDAESPVVVQGRQFLSRDCVTIAIASKAAVFTAHRLRDSCNRRARASTD